jgi:hypothetical protein
MSSPPSESMLELVRHVREANQLTRYTLCKSTGACKCLWLLIIYIIDLVSCAFIIFYDYGEPS